MFGAILALTFDAPPTRAWECKRAPGIVVEPGTRQKVAPRNTQLFVDLSPHWGEEAHWLDPSRQGFGQPSIDRIELCTAPQNDPPAVNDTASTCIQLLEKWRLHPAPENSRELALYSPAAQLTPGVTYAVVARTSAGSAQLADFAVSPEMDRVPPRLGAALQEGFADDPGGEDGPAFTGASFLVTAVFDDTTRDAAIRFEVSHPHRSRKDPPQSATFVRYFQHGQHRLVEFVERSGCEPGNFTLPPDPRARQYVIRAVDLAGNASKPRLVELVKTPSEQESEIRRLLMTENGSLWYLPVLGTVIRGRALAAGGVLLLVTLGSLIAGTVLWRRRR